jgi:hypothetical protein
MVTMLSDTFKYLLKRDNVVCLLRETLLHRDTGNRTPCINIDLPHPDEDSFYKCVFTMKCIINIMWISSLKAYVIVFNTWEFHGVWEVPVDKCMWTAQSVRVLANFLELCEASHVSFSDWVSRDADADDKILLDNNKAIHITQEQLRTCGLSETQERFSTSLMRVVEEEGITSHAELFIR